MSLSLSSLSFLSPKPAPELSQLKLFPARRLSPHKAHPSLSSPPNLLAELSLIKLFPARSLSPQKARSFSPSSRHPCSRTGLSHLALIKPVSLSHKFGFYKTSSNPSASLSQSTLTEHAVPDQSWVFFLSTLTTKTDDVLPSLEEQGVRQLYPKGPNIDYKKELRALNRELQLHLLGLADVLVERPSQYAWRVEEISLIFWNLDHLLNSLRPHQVRATLIHILELQIQCRKQAFPVSNIYFLFVAVSCFFTWVFRRREEAQQLLKESLETLDGHLP
ncbi:hypothetical protein AMTRI_Chr04g189600 [Amborella trichopoda]